MPFILACIPITYCMMKVYLKCNVEKMCRMILEEQLSSLGIKYKIISSGCIEFENIVPINLYTQLYERLDKYNISIIDNNKALLVQKTKNVIGDLLQHNRMPLIKMSSYLEQELNTNYRAIAKAFVEMCHIPIEEYIILSKIEKAKNLLINEMLSLTEVAHRLHYSSVAHLSNQFKRNTGFCPKDFQNVIRYKRSSVTV